MKGYLIEHEKSYYKVTFNGEFVATAESHHEAECEVESHRRELQLKASINTDKVSLN